MRASELVDGMWSTRCSGWAVILEARNGRWAATVASLSTDVPTERVAAHVGQIGFTSPQDAAKWAADKLKDRGISVFLLSSDGGPPKTLVDYMDFVPAVI